MEVTEIRRMREGDLGEVAEIERDLFSMPWSKSSFLFEISNSKTSYAITALSAGVVVGYAVAWFVADELHIGNVAVARPVQGNGVGKILVEHLLSEAAGRETAYATLEVRASNVRAINLYRRYGFRGIAIRKHYYSDNGEDALVMMADIGKPRLGKWPDPGAGQEEAGR